MRKDRYVVGYKTTGNVVYGGNYFCVSKYFDLRDYAEPMTEKQARKALKDMPEPGAAIYKLVEVK